MQYPQIAAQDAREFSKVWTTVGGLAIPFTAEQLQCMADFASVAIKNFIDRHVEVTAPAPRITLA